MADDDEFAAKVTAVAEKQLLVKEGEDIDYRVVLGFYLLGDLFFLGTFIFAREDGWWVVTAPFLPLTIWMVFKVRKQMQQQKAEAEKVKTSKKD